MKDKKIVKIMIIIIILLVVILGVIFGMKIRNDKIEKQKAEIAAEKLQVSIDTINDFYADMEQVKEEVSNCNSIAEMNEVVMASSDIINEFNEYDTSDGNEADVFIDEVRSSPVYELYCKDYITGNLVSEISIDGAIFTQSYMQLYTECIDSILIERPEICKQ